MVKIKCECCKGDAEVRQADLDRGWGKFCSKSCKAIMQSRKGTRQRAKQSIRVREQSWEDECEEMHQQAMEDSSSCHGQDPGDGFF